MSNSYKKTENDVYAYFNYRFRVGLWTTTTLSAFYNKLEYKASKEETDRISKFMGVPVERLPDIADIHEDAKKSFSIKSLVLRVYQARVKAEEEAINTSQAPKADVVIDVKQGKNPSYLSKDGKTTVAYSYDYLIDNGPQVWKDKDGTTVIFQADTSELTTI